MVNSPEELQILQEFERGLRLAEVTRAHGWQDVLDIMEKRVAKAEFALMNYSGSDLVMCAALQRRARDFRELFQDTQLDIAAGIEASHVTPASLQPTETAGLRY